MKSFGFLILSALIAFVLSIYRDEKCIFKEDGKKTCCWWNSNSCCEYTRQRQICNLAITRCCKTYDREESRKVSNTSKIFISKA